MGCLLAANASAAPTITRSPSGAVSLSVDWDGQALTYTVAFEGKTVAGPTPIGLTVDGRPLPAKGSEAAVQRSEARQTLRPPVPTISSQIEDVYRQTVLDFGGVALEVRAADDGAAFRWRLELGEQQVLINDEQFGVDVKPQTVVYFPKPNGQGFFSHQECVYWGRPAARVKAEQLGCVPLLFTPAGGPCLLVTDVNVTDYPGLWMQSRGGGGFRGVFPAAPASVEFDGGRDVRVSSREDYLAKTSGDRALPWRVFIVSSPAGLLDNTLCYRLASPPKVDTAWIKPGKVLWDWWHDQNLGPKPFEVGPNQETYNAYIDFAAEHELPYVLFDEGWAIKNPGPSLTPLPNVDVRALVERAEERGVGVLLWMTAHALEQELDVAFDRFRSWGIRGIKVDFMQRDDQPMMNFCEEVARRAAENQTLVIFHGGSKPTGLHREYPNVVSHESVLGLEQCKWGGGASPNLAVLIPFIRGVVGPVDYTPGAMDNFARDTFKPSYNNPGSQGTRCHQMAMYVVYPCSLPMLADSPRKYAKGGESFELMKRLPTTWDETHVVHGEIGQAVAIARRQGDAWVLAAMTNWTARELACPLGFLGDGQFEAVVWSDDPDEPSAYQVDRRPVDASETLRLNLASGGGAVVEFSPR